MTLARVLANLTDALKARQARNARRIAARNFQTPGHHDDGAPVTVAGWVVCPDCGEEVPIGFAPLELHTDEDGQQSATVDLQMDDLWAHAWTHGTDREPPQ